VAIACLLGGNQLVQRKFLEFMQADNDNKFLQAIKDKMHEVFKKVKEKESERKKKLHDKKKYQLQDEDEGMKTAQEREVEKFEEQIHTKNMRFLIRILRFLQLLCENHNPKLQSHLRVQRNGEGTLIGRNYDFVSNVSYLLNSY